MSKQGALTVILSVDQTKLESLIHILKAIQHKVTKNPILRFQNSPSTHFARFVLIDQNSRLFFSACYDGDEASYIDELHATVLPGLQQVFSHCVDCPTTRAWSVEELRAYLTHRSHSYKSQFFYVAFPGRGVREILLNSATRNAFDQLLDQISSALKSPSPQMPLRIPTGMDSQANLPEQRLTWWEKLIEWTVGIRNPGVTSPNVIASPSFAAIEDIVTQNQMTVIVRIKPSLWSRTLLRLVLWVGSYQGKKAKGALSGISTIHFARWAIIDNGTRLLFESNYDGSWERYIDDFVDKVSVGLNAIWGNCPEYPAGGARDIEAFKKSIRDNQFPAQMFYSAYPETTVMNILNEARIADAIRQNNVTHLAEIATGQLSFPV